MTSIIFNLLSKRRFSLFTLMMMVHRLRGIFQPKRDQQSDRDRHQVDEEVTNPMNPVFRRVYIQHRGGYPFFSID
jgi:hypothetical protein